MKKIKNNANAGKSRKVVEATRNAVVGAGERARMLKSKTTELGRKAQMKWQETKPKLQKTKSGVKKVGQRVVGFGKDVKKGVTEGISELRKRG